MQVEVEDPPRTPTSASVASLAIGSSQGWGCLPESISALSHTGKFRQFSLFFSRMDRPQGKKLDFSRAR